MSEIVTESISFESAYEKQPVAGHLWFDPQTPPKAVVQISHGMAEYLLRYRDFAEYLVEQGFAVCGNDHLGHGETSGTQYPDGFFAPKNGRFYVLRDLYTMCQLAKKRWPGVPYILFGHSMGSFYARWFVESYPSAVDAAVFCGTAGKNPAAGAAILLTDIIQAFKGAQYRSPLCNQLAFGSYLKRIPDAKSPNAWLSVSEENVLRYDADPKCGFLFTVSAFHELTSILQHVNTQEWVNSVPKQLPILLIAGAEDPVGNYGAGPQEVAQRLQAAGVQSVQLTLYDGLRHEILNEACCAQIYAEIAAWCKQAVGLC